jgi:uncharacterized protein YcgI (DUF1989 family)
MPDDTVVIPARQGRAVHVPRGSSIEIINTHGTQVVDLWVLCPASFTEHLSMEHTRVALGRLIPRVGDSLYSSKRRPLMTLAVDTSPGIHDTLMASCDAARYRMLGHPGYHDNCHDNFEAALRELGISPPLLPAPFNLFMNVPWTPDGALRFKAPLSRPGDLVQLHAEMDVIVIMSACPQDLTPVNGHEQRPAEVCYRILAPDGADQAGSAEVPGGAGPPA